jgi:hypothetical protein
VVALGQHLVDVGPALLGQILAPAHVLEVGAGGEAAAGAGDADGAHGLVVANLLDGSEQVEPELLVPRVHGLGARELDGGRAAPAVDVDRVELGHGRGSYGDWLSGQPEVAEPSRNRVGVTQ